MASPTCSGSSSCSPLPAAPSIGPDTVGYVDPSWPYGRAICGVCGGFYTPKADGTLRKHVVWDRQMNEYESRHRTWWFQRHGSEVPSSLR